VVDFPRPMPAVCGPFKLDLGGDFASDFRPPTFDCLPRYTISLMSELKYIRWNDVELETLNPLLDRQIVTGESLMLSRVLLKKGCIVPEHSHLNEQLTYILEGALKFTIDGREIVVSAGEVLCIPPHMPHKAEAIEDTVDLDVFYPPRQDWLNKTDAYLRQDDLRKDDKR
jgi:quercetin dioxygenase-like cupin family protein